MPDIEFDARWSGVHNFSSCFENRDTWGWRWWAGPRAPRDRERGCEGREASSTVRRFLLITVGEGFLFLQSRALLGY